MGAASDSTRVGGRERRAVLAVLLGLAGVKLAVQLAVAGRYGWHRDELYYAAAGRHLAFGYPDFPPGTPRLARGAEIVFGGSLAGFRVLPAGAGAVDPYSISRFANFATSFLFPAFSKKTVILISSP